MILKGNIIIWGTGEACDNILKKLDFKKTKIKAFIDSSQENWGKTKNGIKIFPPKEIRNQCPDLIIVASFSRAGEIIERINSENLDLSVIKSEDLLKSNDPVKNILEIAITDFCNLKCSFCSQGTPVQGNKKTISFSELVKISSFIEPYEFESVKISGGEPTLHPNFRKISLEIRNLFKAKYYILATNGFQLLKYKDIIKYYDQIDLSLYPGQNDNVINEINCVLPELAVKKKTSAELMDITQFPNKNKKNIFIRCAYKKIKKIVQNRIYSCCIGIGESIRGKMPENKVSVIMDENWRDNLEKLNIEKFCRNCFVDVDAPH